MENGPHFCGHLRISELYIPTYLVKLENDYILSDLTKMMSYWPLTTFPAIITYIHIFSERNENTSPSTKSRNPYRKK